MQSRVYQWLRKKTNITVIAVIALSFVTGLAILKFDTIDFKLISTTTQIEINAK